MDKWSKRLAVVFAVLAVIYLVIDIVWMVHGFRLRYHLPLFYPAAFGLLAFIFYKMSRGSYY